MSSRLTNLELHEISCVDAPANEGARVLLFKSLDDPQGGEPADKHKDTKMPDLTEAAVAKMIADATVAADAKTADAIAKALTGAKVESDAEITKALAGAKVEADAEIAKMAARADTAEAAVAVEKLARELAVLEKRAETEFGTLPGTAADKAASLKALEAMPEAARKTLETMLAAGNTAMKASFRPRGVDGTAPAGNGADGELTTKAHAIAAAENLTFAKAFDLACTRNPDLYSRSNDERRARAAAA